MQTALLLMPRLNGENIEEKYDCIVEILRSKGVGEILEERNTLFSDAALLDINENSDSAQ